VRDSEHGGEGGRWAQRSGAVKRNNGGWAGVV
jgi:hypothetical protein